MQKSAEKLATCSCDDLVFAALQGMKFVATSLGRDNIRADIAWAEGSARTGAAPTTPCPPQAIRIRSSRMKALISALALLSFVGTSTVPVFTAQAQGQAPAQAAPAQAGGQPMTEKAPVKKKAAAKKTTKKVATKKAPAKKTAAKKAPATKKVAAKKKKPTTPPAPPAS
jgi:hypothetical protein